MVQKEYWHASCCEVKGEPANMIYVLPNIK